jgi:Holliday junction DNA helicase RuvA|tara:strand:- start:241 stop:840 length:600 start_codon:yes stop_codon:yes gene_type:complete
MIAHLTGKLTHKSPDHIVVDVNGVGYQVFVPLSTFYALPDVGREVSLNIHTHLREAALKLFGFYTEEELKIFEQLITINKVGPKLAVIILSGMPPTDLLSAINSSDVGKLNTIPGIGRKMAERLTLEMRDKLADISREFAAKTEGSVPHNGLFDDALSALVNLGYKKNEVEKTLKSVYSQGKQEVSLENLIKKSLNLLS